MLPFVGEDVEALAIRCDRFNVADASILIHIKFLLAFWFGQIDVNSIILGAYDEFVLSLVENGHFWIILIWSIIHVNGLDFFGLIHVVKFEKLIFFEEEKSIRVVPVEHELRTGVSELPVSKFFNLKFAGTAVHFVDGNFGYINLILDLPLTDDNTKPLFILGNSLIEYFGASVTIWNLQLLLDDVKI